MSVVGAAIGGAAAIAGGIGGAVISSNAAGHAAQTQSEAAAQAAQLQSQTALQVQQMQSADAEKALNYQRDQYAQQQRNAQPYMQAGTSALSQMQDPRFQQGPNQEQINQYMNPAMAFDMAQGSQALQRSAAARGGLMSGGTLKDLTNYSQGVASHEYQNAFNNFTNTQNNQFGRLASIAGMGQNATGMLGSAGQNSANNMSNTLMASSQNIGNTMMGAAQNNNNTMLGAANASAGAQIASGNAIGGTLSSLGTGLGKTYMDAQQTNTMNNWMNNMTKSSGGSSNISPYANDNSYSYLDNNFSLPSSGGSTYKL